jgi:glycosyltransferase involved in cell wall biosynthesis
MRMGDDVSSSPHAGTTPSPRAVLVTHVAPEPPWSGERRRMAAAHSYLSRRYNCELAVCHRSDALASRLRQKARRPLAPPYAAKFRLPNVDLDSYELIWVFELWALSCVPLRLWHRVMWDKDTVMSDSYRHTQRFRERLLRYWTWRYERRAARRVRHAFVSFAEDVTRFGAKNVSALPNGYTPPLGPVPGGGWPRNGGAPRLGFVGLLSHEPNRRALMRFASETLPSLRTEPGLVGLELWVAGAQLRQDDAHRLSTTPGVTVLGYVSEMAEFYAAIDLAIAPMSDGAGTPTKVIEALGHGVPVVGTRRALRGVDEELRQWCVEVADSTWPSGLHAGVRLLEAQDPPAEEVSRRYSWSSVFDRSLGPLLGNANG